MMFTDLEKQKQLNEAINEVVSGNSVFKSITAGKVTEFSKQDLEDELSDMNISADNLAGWLYRALMSGVYSPAFKKPKKQSEKVPFYKKVIQNILKDAISGKLKKIEFESGLRTIKSLDPAKYI